MFLLLCSSFLENPKLKRRWLALTPPTTRCGPDRAVRLFRTGRLTRGTRKPYFDGRGLPKANTAQYTRRKTRGQHYSHFTRRPTTREPFHNSNYVLILEITARPWRMLMQNPSSMERSTPISNISASSMTRWVRLLPPPPHLSQTPSRNALSLRQRAALFEAPECHMNMP